MRITPAGAGKTATGTAYEKEGRDHPRRCGENAFGPEVDFALAGSPPQVRGKRKGDKNMTKFEGITPAGAGKTFNLPIRRTAAQDHPRRCGENYLDKNAEAKAEGSPPQVRGKL